MALISVDEVRATVPTYRQKAWYFSKSASGLLEEQRRTASTATTFDIFLSHSYTDAELIRDLKLFLENFDFTVYVDWLADEQLDRSRVTPETARALRLRMNQCQSLLFATTPNSSESVWMPWELGYFDGSKGRAAIIPLTARKEYGNAFRGQEYLGLYPYVTREHDTTGVDRLWVRTDERTYVDLGAWINGTEPYIHN